MFPVQPSTDSGFRIQNTPQGNQIQDPSIMDNDFFENDLFNFAIGSSDKQVRKRTDSGLPRRLKQKQIKDESSSKKAIHREVERKRRLEMSNLHASLNSLLPDDGLKGKRSVSDQIEEAAAHIKRMEKNIEELKARRDGLKSLFDDTRDCVTINMGSGRSMEILISHGIKNNELGLSRVLVELHRNRLDVMSSVSSRIKERFVHKIHVEAGDMINLDVFVLQDRLSKAMK